MRYPYTVRNGTEPYSYYEEEPKSLKEIIVLMQDYDKDKQITHDSDPEDAYRDYCAVTCEWEQKLSELDFQRYILELEDEYEAINDRSH